MNGWMLIAVVAVATIVALWLAIEIDAWRARRRPPGVGALRAARRDRSQRPW